KLKPATTEDLDREDEDENQELEELKTEFEPLAAPSDLADAFVQECENAILDLPMSTTIPASEEIVDAALERWEANSETHSFWQSPDAFWAIKAMVEQTLQLLDSAAEDRSRPRRRQACEG
ncbi:unnamed protein product, partial [Prorocentrum cordatum]